MIKIFGRLQPSYPSAVETPTGDLRLNSELQSLEISYFIQATEDEEKVRRAVAALVGGGIPEERREAEGHYGNKIVWVRNHLKGGAAEAGLRGIVSRMGGDEKESILGTLDTGLDEHNALYVRLSKQVLVMKGAAVLASSDPIRVKVKPLSYVVKRDPAGFYARLMGKGAD
jgi:RNA binding exosome subunit